MMYFYFQDIRRNEITIAAASAFEGQEVFSVDKPIKYSLNESKTVGLLRFVCGLGRLTAMDLVFATQLTSSGFQPFSASHLLSRSQGFKSCIMLILKHLFL